MNGDFRSLSKLKYNIYSAEVSDKYEDKLLKFYKEIVKDSEDIKNITISSDFESTDTNNNDFINTLLDDSIQDIDLLNRIDNYFASLIYNINKNHEEVFQAIWDFSRKIKDCYNIDEVLPKFKKKLPTHINLYEGELIDNISMFKKDFLNNLIELKEDFSEEELLERLKRSSTVSSSENNINPEVAIKGRELIKAKYKAKGINLSNGSKGGSFEYTEGESGKKIQVYVNTRGNSNNSYIYIGTAAMSNSIYHVVNLSTNEIKSMVKAENCIID